MITCARFGDGAVRCLGADVDGGQHASWSGAMAMAVGGERACSINEHGGVLCEENGVTRSLEGIAQVRTLTMGEDHGCAIVGAGELFCWGDNDDGQLGIGQRSDSAPPSRVALPETVIDADAGWGHTCAVLADGAVYCWGYGHYGQVGPTVRLHGAEPVQVPGLPAATGVVLGTYHSCATTEAGELWCWGYGMGGEDEIDERYRRPRRVPALDGARALSAGMGSTCGIVGPDVRCWIDADELPERSVTLALPGPASSLTGGANHGCAVVAGDAWCWGEDMFLWRDPKPTPSPWKP
jgi:hypothetical protein